MMLDLAFRVQGAAPIPADHGYTAYSAVSHLVPEAHQQNGIALHPISGRQAGDRKLMLMPWSRLTIRVPDDQIATFLKLAGQSLRLGDSSVRVGVPEVRPLIPATALRSRLVIIKVAHVDAAGLTPEVFAIAARKQLDAIGIDAAATLTIGKRRTLCVKRRAIVGYEVLVEGLSAEESIRLQAHGGVAPPGGNGWSIPPCGIGGKRHLGCGVFVGRSEEKK